MNILVTGAHGFVGRHLLEELHDAGHDAVGTDILDGLGADLREAENIERLIRRSNPEVVVHLAHQWPVRGDEVAAAMGNTQMATMVARGCSRAGVRLVLGSSSLVYGDGFAACRELEGPFTPPTTISGLAAMWCEQAGQALAPSRFTAVRLANVYGPNMPGGAFSSPVTEALWCAHHGKPVPVYPGPDRGYCWIGDAVRGITVAIEKAEGPINVGRDDEVVPPRRVADLACIVTGAEPDLIEPAPTSLSDRRVMSSRLQRLGWRPTVSLYEGMVMLYEWVKTLDDEGQPTAGMSLAKELT